MSNQETDMAEDPQLVAFDMAMRVLIGGQVTCGCGIGMGATAAIVMHVLGACSSMVGLDETALDDENFWSGFRENFKRGYALHKAEQEAAMGATVQ